MELTLIQLFILSEFFGICIYPGIKRIIKGQCFFSGYNNYKELLNKDCRKKARFSRKSIKKQLSIYKKTTNIKLRTIYLDAISNVYYEIFAKEFINQTETDYIISNNTDFYYIYKMLINIKDELHKDDEIIKSDEIKLNALKLLKPSDYYKKEVLLTIKNKDLIIKYIIDTDITIGLAFFLEKLKLSDEQIIEIIIKKNIVEVSIISDIIALIEDDNKKIDLLGKYDFTEYNKEKILCTVKDHELIINYLINSDIFTSIVDIIKKIKCNDNMIIKILDNKKHLNNNTIQNLVKLLNNDDNKTKYLSSDKEYTTNILATFTNIELRNKIAKEYDIEINSIIYVMITECKDKQELSKLVYQLNNKSIIEVFESNKEDNITNILEQMKVSFCPNIDQDITFGLELEASHKDYMGYRAIKNILGNWDIKPDSSINNSTEIVSPVLHFNEKDIKQIKYICDFMEKNKFETNEKCGGHIHIGMNYFTNPDELKMLYYLFCNCESIFYLILNRENSIPREKINTYAQNISDIISNNKDKLDNCLTTEELIKQLKITQNFNRYKDINILNAGKPDKNTIEFRLANGEINFFEVMNNIILLITLVQKSKELTYIYNTDNRYEKLMQLSDNISNDIKIHILLDLLFENNKDKEVFLRRYTSNSKLLNTLLNNSLQKMSFESIKFNKELKK